MNLASFSELLETSKGRFFFETDDLNRTCFMRDRDRIIHCSAFRRLKYKTQVFVYHEGDYYRTRLSHSIEVSQLARSIARIFKVNEDLAEAIALAHDLGHTPFGHAGEEALNKKMEKYGGFDHNFQALKILTTLEKKYLNFDGLNLTWESLEGILKHNGPIKKNIKLPDFLKEILKKFNCRLEKNASFEAQIASICDDIAYNNNDIDDGLHAQLFKFEELEDIEIVKENLKKIKIGKNKDKKDRIKHELVRLLIKDMINDLEINTNTNLLKFKPQSAQEVKSINKDLVCFSEEMCLKEKELRVFLKKKMYLHPMVKTMTFKAKKITSDLFDLFINESQLLPSNWKKYENDEDLYVNVCDFISSMTDKNAVTIHKKFYNLDNFSNVL